MNSVIFKNIKLLSLVMAILLFLISVVLPLASSAQGFRQGRHPMPFYPHPGYSVRALPRGHRPIHLGPSTYFFLEGVFYRHAANDYVVITAPIGAVVPLLPAAAILVTIGAMTYYTYADVYYQKIPEGYMVVPPPVKAALPDAAIAWEGDQIRVTVPILNVRSGPGTEHPVIKEVHQGDILVVQSSGSDWYYVKLPDNAFGWVMVKFTSLVKPKGVG